MNINWTVSTLDRRLPDGFVTTAHWQATAQDGEFTASIYATCSWPEGQPVIPYDALTQEMVLAWCWESGVDKDATEAALTQQIEAQANPTEATGVPW